VPREGVLVTVDMMAIPADAPHPRNAHLWLNFLMRAEVIAAITNAVTHPNGYSASLPFLNEAIRNDETPWRARSHSESRLKKMSAM
jgi:putrescine transport system substrate-binding protein